MNFLKGLSIRTKLIIGFVVLALIASVVALISPQIAFRRVVNDVIPTIETVEETGILVRTAQAEALEFVAVGEEEAIEEFQESVRALGDLSDRLTTELSDDAEEVEVFAKLAEEGQNMATIGQAIIDSHARTLEFSEALEDIEQNTEAEFEAARQIIETEIALHIQEQDIEELAEDSIPQQIHLAEFIRQTRILQAEALEFVATGEEEALEEVDAAETRLEAAQDQLAAVVEVDEPGEADLIERLDTVEEDLEATARAMIASHTETLELLEQLEDVEAEFTQALSTAVEEAEEDVERGLNAALLNSIYIALGVLVISIIVGNIFARTFIVPLNQLVQSTEAYKAGDLNYRINMDSQDELGQLARRFNDLGQRLQEANTQATALAQRRVDQFRLITNVGAKIDQALGLEKILKQIANEVKEGFDIYHLQIYLLDGTGKSLVASEGAGLIGQQMKEVQYQAPLTNLNEFVAQAGYRQETINVPDIRQTAWTPHPLIAETKSLIVTPILSEGKLVGVLELLSDEIDDFGEASGPLTQSLANLISSVVQNASLLEKVETALTDLQESQARYINEAWEGKTGVTQAMYHQPNVFITPEEQQTFAEVQQEALTSDRLKVIDLPDTDRTVLVAPVQVLGETIGDIQLHSADQTTWQDEEQVAFVEAVLDQMAQTAENLRLFDETRKKASQEETIREITEKMRSVTSLDQLLQITSESLGQHLSAEYIRLDVGVESRLSNGAKKSL